MKHLLIIFSLLLTSISWSKDVDYDDLVKRDGLYYEKFNDEPFTGKTNGRIQGNFKDGKRDGEWSRYLKNGQLSSKEYYKDGKKIGEHFYYNDNGQLIITYIYKDDKLIETIKH